jgi:hypothetical protein
MIEDTGVASAVAVMAPYLFALGNLIIAAIAAMTLVLAAKGRLFPK